MKLFRFRKENYRLVLTILRYSAGSVFLWFGLDKWVHPAAWYSWIDVWIWPLALFSPPVTMFLIGFFETVIGFLLIMGIMPRVASAVGAAYIAAVTIMTGVSDAAIRDLGVLGCCVALFAGSNASSREPIEDRWVDALSSAFVIWLFIAGLLYLRQGF